jgi:hypothetical protein
MRRRSTAETGGGDGQCVQDSVVPRRKPDRAHADIAALFRRMPVVIAAVAREMAAFLWAIGCQIAPAA